MAKPGRIKLNRKTVAAILKAPNPQLAAAAQKILDATGDPEARIVEYVTDRYVYGVVVPADSQAKHGTATRAASQARGG